jgi:hypothetical protein
MKTIKTFVSAATLFWIELASAQNVPEATDNDLAQGVIPANSTITDKLQDGSIALNDIPVLALYWINWIPQIAGTIAVVMLMYGGLMLIVGGITEDKENAKNTIKWALIGIVVSSLAWVIVNFLQTALTR